MIFLPPAIIKKEVQQHRQTILQKNADTAIGKLPFATSVDFPVLCYDSTGIRDILNSTPRPHKLVFKFNLADTADFNPSLRFYKARNNGTFLETRRTLEEQHYL